MTFGLYTDMSSIRRIIERNISESDSCLNLYSYTGAFSLMALKQGAKEVHSVDLSESYLRILEKNIGLNEFVWRACITRDFNRACNRKL